MNAITISDLKNQVGLKDQLVQDKDKEIEDNTEKINEIKLFLNKLNTDLLGPDKNYSVQEIKRLTKEYEKNYWEIFALVSSLQQVCKQNTKERFGVDKQTVEEYKLEKQLKDMKKNEDKLQTLAEYLHKEVNDKLLKEYNTSISREVKALLDKINSSERRHH